MSASVLILLLLAIPGLSARSGRSWVMRVRQRRDRDLLSTVSLLVPLSLVFLSIAYWILSRPCWGGFTCASSKYDIVIAFNTLNNSPHPLAFLPLLAVATSIGFITGAIFGKFTLWRLGPQKLGAQPLDALMGGTTLPVVGAAVLTTTQINNKLLVYYGQLHGIQIGPDGKVDFVVLSGQIKKSLLSDGKQDGTTSTEKAGYPVTKKPFQIIAESGARNDGYTVKTDRLVIESEDIANIHLELYDAISDGDVFDRFAYFVGRKTGLIQAKPPKPPSSSPSPQSLQEKAQDQSAS